MIQIIESFRYRLYKGKSGPFICFFYNQINGIVSDILNISLIKYIQTIETEFLDLPILGFEYNAFSRLYKFEKIKSCNDILVIKKDCINRVWESPLPWVVNEIFDKIREERYEIRIAKNSDYKISQKNIKTRIWYTNSHKKNNAQIFESNEERWSYQNSLMGIPDEKNSFKMPLIKNPKINNLYEISKSLAKNINLKRKNDDLKTNKLNKKIKRYSGENFCKNIEKVPYIDLNFNKPSMKNLMNQLSVDNKSSCLLEEKKQNIYKNLLSNQNFETFPFNTNTSPISTFKFQNKSCQFDGNTSPLKLKLTKNLLQTKMNNHIKEYIYNLSPYSQHNFKNGNSEINANNISPSFSPQMLLNHAQKQSPLDVNSYQHNQINQEYKGSPHMSSTYIFNDNLMPKIVINQNPLYFDNHLLPNSKDREVESECSFEVKSAKDSYLNLTQEKLNNSYLPTYQEHMNLQNKITSSKKSNYHSDSA